MIEIGPYLDGGDSDIRCAKYTVSLKSTLIYNVLSLCSPVPRPRLERRATIRWFDARARALVSLRWPTCECSAAASRPPSSNSTLESSLLLTAGSAPPRGISNSICERFARESDAPRPAVSRAKCEREGEAKRTPDSRHNGRTQRSGERAALGERASVRLSACVLCSPFVLSV